MMRNNDEPVDPKKLDKMLYQLERQMHNIETDEIVNGQTEEELEERGFISDDTISIDRSEHMRERITGGYSFPPGLKYHTHPPVRSSTDIENAVLDGFPIVAAASVTITRTLNEKPSENVVGKMYGQHYLNECNFSVSVAGTELRFVPLVDGRIVLAGDRLYLIPSNRDGSFTIYINEENMKAVGYITPPDGDGRMPTMLDIRQELERLGVKTGLRIDTIESALAEASRSNRPVNDVVVAHGTQPVHGQDAKVNFRFDTNPTMEEFRILPNGQIDYRKNANITSVQKDAILASITDPIPGVDGLDLFGNVVGARLGKSSFLCPGMNVTVDKSNVFKAACSGQVSLNGNVLEVFQHYVVEGDVDYKSGNIRFNGNVTVRGNVQPGFEVIADGDIEVHGTSDGALLKAGRDILVNGGIIGRGTTKETLISCERDLLAKHIQNGYIEAQGDVIVKNSIVQSTVKAGGRVLLHGGTKAAVIGGSVCALNGVEAMNIGSEYGVRTAVEAGNDYLVSKACDEMEESIQFCEKNIHKIDQIFLSFKTLITKGLELDTAKQAQMMQIKKKREQLYKYRSIMKSKKNELLKQSPKNVSAIIRVNQTVFPDVVLRIIDIQKQIKEPIHRVCFRYNATKREMQLFSLSDDRTQASDMHR